MRPRRISVFVSSIHRESNRPVGRKSQSALPPKRDCQRAYWSSVYFDRRPSRGAGVCWNVLLPPYSLHPPVSGLSLPLPWPPLRGAIQAPGRSKRRPSMSAVPAAFSSSLSSNAQRVAASDVLPISPLPRLRPRRRAVLAEKTPDPFSARRYRGFAHGGQPSSRKRLPTPFPVMSAVPSAFLFFFFLRRTTCCRSQRPPQLAATATRPSPRCRGHHEAFSAQTAPDSFAPSRR